MTVTAPKETSTDARLADLSEKVDAGFAKVDKDMKAGFARVDTDIREIRSAMKGLDAKYDAKFASLGAKIDRWTVGLFSATALGILLKFIT